MLDSVVLSDADIQELMRQKRTHNIWIDSDMNVHSGHPEASIVGRFETTNRGTRRYMCDKGVVAYTPKRVV